MQKQWLKKLQIQIEISKIADPNRDLGIEHEKDKIEEEKAISVFLLFDVVWQNVINSVPEPFCFVVNAPL